MSKQIITPSWAGASDLAKQNIDRHKKRIQYHRKRIHTLKQTLKFFEKQIEAGEPWIEDLISERDSNNDQG